MAGRDRHETGNQVLREATAEFVAREAGPQSLITVTHAELSSDFTHATVFLSVLPEDKAPAALALMERKVTELRQYLKEHTKLPRSPYIEFALERSLS